jgi:hypothetical protein
MSFLYDEFKWIVVFFDRSLLQIYSLLQEVYVGSKLDIAYD